MKKYIILPILLFALLMSASCGAASGQYQNAAQNSVIQDKVSSKNNQIEGTWIITDEALKFAQEEDPEFYDLLQMFDNYYFIFKDGSVYISFEILDEKYNELFGEYKQNENNIVMAFNEEEPHVYTIDGDVIYGEEISLFERAYQNTNLNLPDEKNDAVTPEPEHMNDYVADDYSENQIDNYAAGDYGENEIDDYAGDNYIQNPTDDISGLWRFTGEALGRLEEGSLLLKDSLPYYGEGALLFDNGYIYYAGGERDGRLFGQYDKTDSSVIMIFDDGIRQYFGLYDDGMIYSADLPIFEPLDDSEAVAESSGSGFYLETVPNVEGQWRFSDEMLARLSESDPEFFEFYSYLTEIGGDYFTFASNEIYLRRFVQNNELFGLYKQDGENIKITFFNGEEQEFVFSDSQLFADGFPVFIRKI